MSLQIVAVWLPPLGGRLRRSGKIRRLHASFRLKPEATLDIFKTPLVLGYAFLRSDLAGYAGGVVLAWLLDAAQQLQYKK
jgi:hypothetical protein